MTSKRASGKAAAIALASSVYLAAAVFLACGILFFVTRDAARLADSHATVQQ